MDIPGIMFKNYKSFKNEYVDMLELGKINIFIGRNNSGKSSCLDIIESLTDVEVYRENAFRNEKFKIILTHELSDEDIRFVFPEHTRGDDIPAKNYYEFGKKFIGKEMMFSLEINNQTSYHDFSYKYVPNEKIFSEKYNMYWKQFERGQVNFWGNYYFRRIDAERNIIPEVEDFEEYVDSNGNGASNLVRKFLNYNEYDEDLVQRKMLDSLNEIVYPDAKFEDIKIQQIKNGKEFKWEIFLQEDGRRYALSKMGSGSKTILLVLINLYLIPELNKYKYKKIVYAFEELENNLHPALQRRLFDFLYKYGLEKDVIMFITTHSHVAINTFCDKEYVKVFHVEKNEGISKLHKIDNYISKNELLNDLDVRASDLLQSNGIIWVEGPSDRIYIKKWLEIFGNNKLEEGRDYQFLYYGGKLLSHYTVEKDYTDLINVLLTNRNAAIVIDSDRRNQTARINETKKRIKAEFENNNLFCWITKGKEIENYLSKESIEQAYEKKLKKQCDRFELFPEYISPICKKFNKVEFAHKVAPYITEENSKTILDLEKQVISLNQTIKKWNMK